MRRDKAKLGGKACNWTRVRCDKRPEVELARLPTHDLALLLKSYTHLKTPESLPSYIKKVSSPLGCRKKTLRT